MTSLGEMLELPNIGHMTISAISLQSPGNFFSYVMDRNYNIITIISKNLYFKKA